MIDESLKSYIYKGTEEASAVEAIRILVMSYYSSDYRQKVLKQAAELNKVNKLFYLIDR